MAGRPNSKTCELCGREFAPKRSNIVRWKRTRFCSHECSRKSARSQAGRWTDTTRTCTVCKTEKLLTEFYSNPRGSRGRQPRCKACHYLKMAAYRAANPELAKQIRERYHREKRDGVNHTRLLQRFKQHGLTLDQYHSRAEAQDFRCAICEDVPDDLLHIDHDHRTNRVRGLLCRLCNVGLGSFRDNTASLVAASRYLEAAE